MNIKLNNTSSTEATIEIEGEIGMPEELQSAQNSVTTYEKFRDLLVQMVEGGVAKIRVNIRSTGGSVSDALLIHGALCELQGVEIHTYCYGFTASAATIIAQAASENCRHVASTALYLVHNASTAIEGNAATVEATALLLEKTDERIAEIYAERSGYPVDHFRRLMDRQAGRGDWLTPNEVLEAGLADVIEEISPLKTAVAKLRNLMRQIFEPVEIDTAELEVLNATKTTQTEPAVATALPTVTLPKEDPTIENTVVSLSGNQNAYLRDVELFRD